MSYKWYETESLFNSMYQMVYAKLNMTGRFCPDWGWDCRFVLEKRKERGGDGHCIATWLLKLHWRLHSQVSNKAAARMINEHLAGKVFNTVN